MQSLKLVAGITFCLLLGGLFLWAGSDSGLLLGPLPLFMVCGVSGFILHWLVFIPSFIYQTDRYFDLTGALSFLLTVMLVLLNLPAYDTRTLLLAAMVCAWALRLGSFLFLRVRRQGKDSRFDTIKTRPLRFLFSWTLGGLWVLVTIAPALAAMTTLFQQPLSGLSYVAIALWLLGFGLETVADRQKTAFRNDADNRDKFIRQGLWAWSRHPNYLGEIILWLGTALLALPVLAGWQLLTLSSPLLVIILLTRVSGIPLLERSAENRWGKDPDYQAYCARTPILLPRLIRKQQQRSTQ